MATKKYTPLDRRVPVSNIGSPLEDFMAFAGELENTYKSGPLSLTPRYGYFGNELFSNLSEDDQDFIIRVLEQRRIVETPGLARNHNTEKEIADSIAAAERGETYTIDPQNRNLALPQTEEEAEAERDQTEEYIREQEALVALQRQALGDDAPTESRASAPIKPAPVAEQKATPPPPSRTEVRSSTAVTPPAQRPPSPPANTPKPTPASTPAPAAAAPAPSSQETAQSSNSLNELEEDETLESIEELERLREAEYQDQYDKEAPVQSRVEVATTVPPAPAPAAPAPPPPAPAPAPAPAAPAPPPPAPAPAPASAPAPAPAPASAPSSSKPAATYSGMPTGLTPEQEQAILLGTSPGTLTNEQIAQIITALVTAGTQVLVDYVNKQRAEQGLPPLEMPTIPPVIVKPTEEVPAEASGEEELPDDFNNQPIEETTVNPGEVNYNPNNLKNGTGTFDLVLYAQAMAVVESAGGNRFAISPGNAKGLYQFISKTWNSMARRAGEWDAKAKEATGRYRIAQFEGDLSDGRFSVDTSTEALVSLATGHISEMERRKIPLTYANLYMYHCAEGLAPQEIKKAMEIPNVIWSEDTFTPEQKAQWDTQSYWNPGYYYKKVTRIKSREQIRAEILTEAAASGGRSAPSEEILKKDISKRYNHPRNQTREEPRTWLEVYNRKIGVMNAAVKTVLGKRVRKEYQRTIYVEIPEALNKRGYYKINNGQPVDPSLDEDLVPGQFGESDGSSAGGGGDTEGGTDGSGGAADEWWKAGCYIPPAERAKEAEETRRYIQDAIVQAINRLPKSATNEEASIFKKYQLQVQALEDEGWKLYEEDLTAFNLFYKEHSLSIICDDSNSFPMRGDSSPIVCDFISGTSFNLFKKLPMQGITLPTAQYLGKNDDSFLISLRCNGLNAVKHIEVMRDILKKQAIIYKYIPSSFSLKVENNFINAFGNLYFVINGMESSTQPETPGSYAMEMRLTANDLVIKETLINRESTISTAEIKETFLRELASNAPGLIVTNEAEAYPESAPDACAPNGSEASVPTTTPAVPVDPVRQSMMEQITEKRIHLTIGSSILGYKDLVYFNEDEVFDWMSEESRFFLQELCAVINLCKCLIIPNGYHYAEPQYKLKIPLHKKLIKAIYDGSPSLLSSSLPVDQPLFWVKRHQGEVQYKNDPQTERYMNYIMEAEEQLEKIAPPLWDYVLEYEHIEYDVSESVLRASAYTSVDAEQYLPYARARADWAKIGNPLVPFLPYLAAHRAVNVMSNNTIFNYQCDVYWKRPDLIDPSLNRPKGTVGQAEAHFYLNSHYVAEKNGSRYYQDRWFTLNSFGTGREDDFRTLITVLRTSAEGDSSVKKFAGKNIKWYLWPYSDRIVPSNWTSGQVYSRTTVASGGGAGQPVVITQPGYAIEVAKEFQELNPTYDYSVPWNQLPTIPAKADPIDASLMEYIWNYLIIPYINNALNYENIYLLATETNSFPKTLELISRQIQNKIQPTYSDLMLPKHPYWNEKDANALRGTAFTEPDFYLFNVSTESDFERNSERVEYLPSDNAVRGDSELHISPEAAYNLSIQAEVETRMAEIEGLQQLDYDLNVKNKVIGKGNSVSYGKSVPKASRWEYYRASTTPKTMIPSQAPSENSEAAKSVSVDPQAERVEWQDVSLMFGENLDLIGSLSANVGKDQKLLNSRVLNYAWQDYDAMSAEDKIIELRKAYYAEPLISVPLQPGTVAGNNPGNPTPPNTPPNQGGPMPMFDWSQQRVLVIGSSSAMGIGDRLGKNLGYENKTAAAYLNIGVGGTAVRHWANNRHKWPTKWHYVEKKDANGNVILETKGKRAGQPAREKIVDEFKIPLDELAKALSDFRPTVIHIVLGANDDAERRGEKGLAPDKESILQIKERLKDYITVWWVGPGSTKFPAHQPFREILKENWGPYYYDWTLMDPNYPIQYLAGDKVHLTPAGSTKWTEVFKEFTQDGVFKEGVPADQCIPVPASAPGSVPTPAATPDGLPAPAQGDPAKTRMVSKFFQFWEEDEEGSGDTSPYMNFSNTRYPTYVKLKDAIKSVNRRKMAGRRAYPVCKVYFMEEDEIYNRDSFELDEIYSYSEVESLEISDSRKRPASVAKITFLDPHGILSGYNQWAAAASPRFLQEKQNLRYGSANELSTESTLKGVTGSRYEQSDISFALRAGLKIKICLGFSNDANKLSEVFLGEITDINLDGSGDRIEVVALSYGAELAAVTKGLTEKEAEVEYNDTFDLLAHLMFEPEVIHFGKKKFSEISMFGENQSLKTNQIQYKETFSRGGSMNLHRGTGLVNAMLAGWDTGDKSIRNADFIDGVWDLWNRKVAEADKELAIEPFAGPQDDNIFAPNFLPSEGSYAYDWFAMWQGKVSGDYDLRVRDRESKSANPGYEGLSTQIANMLGTGVAIAGLILVIIAAFAATGVISTLVVLLIGSVLAVGIGIIAAAAIGVVIGVGKWAWDLAFGDPDSSASRTAKRENLLDEAGVKKDGAEDIVDSALLIYTYSPDELKYNIFHSTIWDVFQEMTLRHPGYVAHPRIYEKSNRMTMFFGLPDQNMWYTAGNRQDTIKANAIFKAMAREADAYYQKKYSVGELIFNGFGWGDGRSDGAPNDIQSFRAGRTSGGNVFQDNNTGVLTVRADLLNVFLKYVRKRYKPFRKWHNINSYTDIISNDIEASSQGWFTVVNIQYQYTRWWGADSASEDAAEKFEDRAKALSITDAASFAKWDENRVIKQKANLDLAPNHERSTTFQFLNAKSKGMAKTYGRAKLAHEAKEMYKGSVTVMGSPHIRPYDVVMLNDTYNNMYGPIEVEEVHHIFSPETGYITVIYPDTFIIHEDITPYLLWNGLSADVYTRTEFYMQTALAAYPTWGDLQSVSSKGRAYFSQLRDVISAYRQSAARESLEVEEVKELFDVFSTAAGAATAFSSGTLGFTTASLYGAAALGAVGGIAILAGAAILGVAAGLYASYKLNDIILNYVAESRSYMIVPLMRDGIPMVSGINITSSSGMYKTPLQYMRQYWMDGGQGRALEQTDTLMKYSYMYQRRGGDLNNWLARVDLGWDQFTLDWSSAFHDLPDLFVQEKLFAVPGRNSRDAGGGAPTLDFSIN